MNRNDNEKDKNAEEASVHSEESAENANKAEIADEGAREINVLYDLHEDGAQDSESEESGRTVQKKLGLIFKIPAVFSLGLAIFSVVLRICLAKQPWAGEVFYRYVSRYLQAFMGKLTSFLPFSLAETIIILMPLIAIVMMIFAVYRFIKRDSYRLKRTVVCLFTVICLVVSNFVLNLSILYCRPSLEELTGLDGTEVGADELCAASLYAVIQLDALTGSGSFEFDADGASVCPYSFTELDEKIDDAFDRYAEENDWMSPYGAKAKIIAFSDYMTYTHISGIYTQYTGEVNINVNYPDYVVCSTIAHEKAHQRGIAPEDEANLAAFFVLCESGDPYLEYCGYMSVFSNLANDTYGAAPQFYSRNISPYIPEKVHSEFSAYSKFFRKYEESEASKKVETVNNAYIQMNGDENGTASYNMVSEMAAKYILRKAEAEYSAE